MTVAPFDHQVAERPKRRGLRKLTAHPRLFRGVYTRTLKSCHTASGRRWEAAIWCTRPEDRVSSQAVRSGGRIGWPVYLGAFETPHEAAVAVDCAMLITRGTAVNLLDNEAYLHQLRSLTPRTVVDLKRALRGVELRAQLCTTAQQFMVAPPQAVANAREPTADTPQLARDASAAFLCTRKPRTPRRKRATTTMPNGATDVFETQTPPLQEPHEQAAEPQLTWREFLEFIIEW